MKRLQCGNAALNISSIVIFYSAKYLISQSQNNAFGASISLDIHEHVTKRGNL